MSITAGIDRVRVFAIAGGIGGEGLASDVPFTVLVKWRSVHADKLHRIYVNGRLAGVTSDCLMRQMVVGLPVCFGGAIRIEVVAVEPGEGDCESFVSDAVGSQDGRVRLRWVRAHGLPFEGRYEIYVAVGGGEIDFSGEAIARGQIWEWAPGKAGFGLGGFGDEDFGFDSGGACGFGRGSFGRGEFGLDADECEWVSGELETGRYRFAVRFLDAAGIEMSRLLTDEVAVVRRRCGIKKIRLEKADAGLLQFAIE